MTREEAERLISGAFIKAYYRISNGIYSRGSNRHRA
jgi:hypothetical protein